MGLSEHAPRRDPRLAPIAQLLRDATPARGSQRAHV